MKNFPMKFPTYHCCPKPYRFLKRYFLMTCSLMKHCFLMKLMYSVKKRMYLPIKRCFRSLPQLLTKKHHWLMPKMYSQRP